jgi:excisionase family DNA binding protein
MDRLALKPSEVGEALGICRTKAYELIRGGIIPSILVGASRRVPVESLKVWVEEQTRAPGASDPALTLVPRAPRRQESR